MNAPTAPTTTNNTTAATTNTAPTTTPTNETTPAVSTTSTRDRERDIYGVIYLYRVRHPDF